MSLMASGMFIYRAAYFGIYTISKRIYLNANSSDSTVQTMRTPFLVSLALAEFSSFTGTIISYPLETIARQKMLWSGHGLKNYVTTRQMISRVLKKDGPIGFYRGVIANQLTTICGSFVLVTYDLIKGHYDILKEPKAASNTRRLDD
ncbi:ADP/ATP translocase 4-like isoform X2 [Osmia bicornis bicornis]|uniref:ADP/ATP translocase 4-like isoform X2 n=1 Tax=Osmia bicornis bicornis TaxID=1437191 RepID=UPI001EAEE472|nr:ADP/ATP translocase 4-like isoform X2 [Osmia bicornis bicornis]